MLIVLAFAIGVACGLRSMSGPAAVAWAARSGALRLSGTPVAFLANPTVGWILIVCAIGEWIADKTPFIPSRKTPGPLFFRLLSGAVCGAAISLGVGPATSAEAGLSIAAGLIGAFCGTFGGYEFRRRLVQAIGGKDWPIALLEDAIAVSLLAFALWQLARFAPAQTYLNYDVL